MDPKVIIKICYALVGLLCLVAGSLLPQLDNTNRLGVFATGGFFLGLAKDAPGTK